MAVAGAQISTYEDIGTAILYKLRDVLLAELHDPYPDGDPLQLKAVSIGTLQQDPTSDDYKNHIRLDFLPADGSWGSPWNGPQALPWAIGETATRPQIEIGGGEIWIWRYGLSARLYVEGESRDVVAERRSSFLHRLTQCLRRNITLGGLQNADQTEALLGSSTTVIEKIRLRLPGTDGEAFAIIELGLAYMVEMWTDPSGVSA